jgi:hypothetical protein
MAGPQERKEIFMPNGTSAGQTSARAAPALPKPGAVASIRPAPRWWLARWLRAVGQRMRGYDEAMSLIGQREATTSEIARQRGHLALIRGGAS